MQPDARVFVAGHRGLVGSALLRRLEAEGVANVIVRTRDELDLTQAGPVLDFFRKEKPTHVFLAAARVGGIKVNQARPADFIRENLLIQTSVLQAAFETGVRRLIFFSSACVYPRECAQPMKEESIGTGPMEPTSEGYSTAKLAGLALCRAYNRQHGTDFLALIPATLYGPNDNLDPESSHVLSGLMRRFHEERTRPELTLWGTGEPVREFLYVDDLADACLFLMSLEGPEVPTPINVGTGKGTRIRDLADRIKTVVGAEGKLVTDPSIPDGAPRKVLDVSRMQSLGWTAQTSLDEGLKRTYEWYLRKTG